MKNKINETRELIKGVHKLFENILEKYDLYGTPEMKNHIEKYVENFNKKYPEYEVLHVYFSQGTIDNTDFQGEIKFKDGDIIELSMSEEYAEEDGGHMEINMRPDVSKGHVYNIYPMFFQKINPVEYALEKYIEFKKTGDIKSIDK